MQKTIVIDGERVEYTLERKRVKNINLRIKPDGSIYVSAARGVPVAAIERMMLANAPYITAHREKAAARMERLRDCADGRAVRLFGAVCPVEVYAGTKNAVELEAGRVIISLRDARNAELRQKTLDKWLRAVRGRRYRLLWARLPRLCRARDCLAGDTLSPHDKPLGQLSADAGRAHL